MNFHGIFGWLLNHFVSATMLGFAASNFALAGGDGGAGDMAGAGDGSGEGDGTQPGFGEGDGGGEGEDQDLDLGDGSGEGQQLTQQQRAAAAQEARLGADAKNLLKELKDTNDPKKIKLADSIRQALFSQQSWRQAFPGGIRQAREMRQAFEEVGGADGIRAIQEEKQSLNDELQTIDQSWEDGDPQFIAGLAEENPEAFSKAAPVVLEQWRKVDKDGYNFTTARIFHNTLNSSGVLGVISSLWALAQANKATPGMAGIIEGLQQIGNVFENIRELAANQPEHKPDAGLKKLNAERSKFENDRFTAFKQDVHSANVRNLETALSRHLGKFLKAKNIDFRQLQARDPETFKAMLREAESRLTTALTNDRGFQQQKDRLLQGRDRAGALRLYQQKIEYLLGDAAGPKIARAVANIFFRGSTGRSAGATQNRQNAGGNQRRLAAANGGGGNGVVRISSRPEPAQIDYSRTTDSMILDGRCYIKNKPQIHAWR